MLSGSYEVPDNGWLSRTSVSLLALDPDRNIRDLRKLLDNLQEASVRYENIQRAKHIMERRATEAEDAVKAATVEVAEMEMINTQEGPKASDTRASSTIIPDVVGHERKPDPLTAQNSKELIYLLRNYYDWSGRPSFRDMKNRVPDGPSYSTYRNVLRSNSLPKRLKTLDAFIRALGGNSQDVQDWATAWRSFVPPA